MERPYYIYLYGGDYSERLSEQEVLFAEKNMSAVVKDLSNGHIRYFVFYKNNFAPNAHQVNMLFYKNHFKSVYEDNDAIVFDTR